MCAFPPAHAAPPEVSRLLVTPQLVGEAEFRPLGFHIFDAALWTEDGAFSWSAPFALTLTYRRAISRSSLIDRTLQEMARTGGGASGGLRASLETCFADVRAGDRFSGASVSADTARFYLNGEQRCTITSPGFSRHFFGIWLDGRREELAARLTGRS